MEKVKKTISHRFPRSCVQDFSYSPMPVITLRVNEQLPGQYDVIVIGGGGAGMFCAFTAANRGKSVLLLEHNDQVGKKIAISGGGRCNFTNINATDANYLSNNPDFCKSALARYSPWDFITLVEKHGIPYHEKKLGQQFCDESSRRIISMLESECREARVKILCGSHVEDIEKNDRFAVRTSRATFTADAVVVATGGLSFAKLGATDTGYRIARKFGIGVTELRPGLVPLTFHTEEKDFFTTLAGVALPVRITRGDVSFEEAMLFTHRGVSGPAILQISSYWREGASLSIDLLPERTQSEAFISALRSGSSPLQTLSKCWPRRFAEAWCHRHAPDKPLAQCTKAETDTLLRKIRAWEESFAGTEGYPKAEVTLGGINTGELSSKSMESRNVPGLYFIGEVVDVTGWLGGYNFQWAWASAHACGTSI
jgi:predicted Rossmann fold flavoprotein